MLRMESTYAIFKSKMVEGKCTETIDLFYTVTNSDLL